MPFSGENFDLSNLIEANFAYVGVRVWFVQLRLSIDLLFSCCVFDALVGLRNGQFGLFISPLESDFSIFLMLLQQCLDCMFELIPVDFECTNWAIYWNVFLLLNRNMH